MSSTLYRYVALGDSSGVGVGASDGGYPERLFQQLKAADVPVGILNLAQSGATTREVVQGQVQTAIAKQPHLVTVGIGTNDLWRMVPVGTFEANLKLIADTLERTEAQVVVANLVDLSLAPIAGLVDTLLHVPRTVFQQRIFEMNARIDALARRPRCTVVDLFNASRGELPSCAHYFCSDGFHPSAAGYDRWAELMWPAVRDAVDRWGSDGPRPTRWGSWSPA